MLIVKGNITFDIGPVFIYFIVYPIARRSEQKIYLLHYVNIPATGMTNNRNKFMPEKLLYKKYGNRRLYDTTKSSYVNLEDITRTIREGRQVQVVDAKTKEDVTSFILTQIILEESRKSNFLLPLPLLHLIIQYGEDILHEFFQKYLEQVLKNYLSYRTMTDGHFKKWLEMGIDYSAINPFKPFFDIFPGPPDSPEAQNSATKKA
jgi:polyhydroxyalkanoate synthesis repressor PhaR